MAENDLSEADVLSTWDSNDAFKNFPRSRKSADGSALEERTAAERRALGPALDGRSANKTGRTEQINFKTTPEFKKLVRRLAEETGSPMVEIVEWCVEAYAQEFKREQELKKPKAKR